MESSDDGIIGKDLTGIIRSWNRGAEIIFGYSADEVVGREVQMLFPPDRLNEEDLIVTRIRRGERVDHLETIRRRKDGSDFPVSVTISPIRNAEGVIVGASKIVRDISQARRAQIELMVARDDLERVLAERTKALEERDLLLREVYHRVKNNLQIVDGLLALQAVKIHDAPARDAIESVRIRVQALGLVHQQLMGSDDLRTFDVAPFLGELVQNIAQGAASGGLSVSLKAAPLKVGLDFAIPLGLLVTELVSNALKHAFPTGEGAVVVRFHRTSDGQALLEVIDNGSGLPLGGADLGLGMVLVKRLVAQMGGAMAISSGGGATVRITAPLKGIL